MSNNNVYDITDALARKTAEHLLTLTSEGEAGLTARLSLFPDEHVRVIVQYAKALKVEASYS